MCDPAVNFNVENTIGVMLNDRNKHMLDEEISEGELFDAVMTLKTGKAQGCDGLGAEFYRKFWKVLVRPLSEMYVRSLELGVLLPSARRGVINLIPKKNKDELNVQSWRPISLCNYDYKIWAKAIANRLELVADDLIGKQQYGFMKGRNIACNIRKTVEILGYSNRSKQAAVIIQIDFEKCFDRVSFASIRKTFRYFNFGENFIRMLMLIYSKFQLCTVNNG